MLHRDSSGVVAAARSMRGAGGVSRGGLSVQQPIFSGDAASSMSCAAAASAAGSTPHPLPWLMQGSSAFPSRPAPSASSSLAFASSAPALGSAAAAPGAASSSSARGRSGVEGRAGPYRAQVEGQKEIQAAFRAFDTNGVGHVDYEDVVAAVHALGLPLRKSEVRALLRERGVEPEDPAGLDFEVFAFILERGYSMRSPIDAMLESFRLFDLSGQGRVGLADLRHITREILGASSSSFDGELRALVARFDRNGDGMLDEGEFLAMLAETSLR